MAPTGFQRDSVNIVIDDNIKLTKTQREAVYEWWWMRRFRELYKEQSYPRLILRYTGPERLNIDCCGVSLKTWPDNSVILHIFNHIDLKTFPAKYTVEIRGVKQE